MNGFLIVDKPDGVTSHDVVAAARRMLKQKKVGHTGTLDPFATGVLPLALGEATKAIPFLDESEKRYRARMYLGISTDTQDRTGTILSHRDHLGITKDKLVEVFSLLKGTSFQTPPMFSAIKKGGIPLYKIARRGEEVERVAREITVHEITIESVEMPFVTFLVSCSRGTYVRTLASDLGDILGCGAHLCELRRLKSGPFAVENAVSPDMLRILADGGGIDEILISPYHALSHLKDFVLTARGAEKVRHGISPGKGDFSEFPPDEPGSGQKVRLSFEGRLLAVAVINPTDDSDTMKTVCLLRVFS
jgi:tRNA pseudouridine55 synthase